MIVIDSTAFASRQSNAIEGSTLTFRETQLILETGLTIGGKSLREYLEVINHQEAIKYVDILAAQDEPITALHLRQIHRLVLARIDDDSAGFGCGLISTTSLNQYFPETTNMVSSLPR